MWIGRAEQNHQQAGGDETGRREPTGTSGNRVAIRESASASEAITVPLNGLPARSSRGSSRSTAPGIVRGSYEVTITPAELSAILPVISAGG